MHMQNNMIINIEQHMNQTCLKLQNEILTQEVV